MSLAAGSGAALAARLDASRPPPRALRRLALENLSRMGHCAPTVMKTLLDASGTDAPWLVKLVAGMPGGIGNTRAECGAVTAPLVLLGLEHARDAPVDGVPAVVDRAQAYLGAFRACHGSTSCRDILGDARLPLPCIPVIRRAPGRYVDLRARAGPGTVEGERRDAFALLHAHLSSEGFHCAHAVLRAYRLTPEPDPELLDATAAFVGGTAFSGMTCSALAAGVMLLGLELGQIEDSRPRVLKLLGVMALGGDAFRDDLNAFNRPMNLGHALARWFTGVAGSTQCSAVTGCDLATVAGVRRYADGGGVGRCRELARAVALEVRRVVEAARTSPAAR